MVVGKKNQCRKNWKTGSQSRKLKKALTEYKLVENNLKLAEEFFPGVCSRLNSHDTKSTFNSRLIHLISQKHGIHVTAMRRRVKSLRDINIRCTLVSDGVKGSRGPQLWNTKFGKFYPKPAATRYGQ